jgi:hypothetical protein
MLKVASGRNKSRGAAAASALVWLAGPFADPSAGTLLAAADFVGCPFMVWSVDASAVTLITSFSYVNSEWLTP